MVEWGNVTTDPSTQVDYFMVLAKEVSGRGGKYKIISSAKRFCELKSLKKSAEYNVTVIAVDVLGIPCRSTGMIRWTDQSGEQVINIILKIILHVSGVFSSTVLKKDQHVFYYKFDANSYRHLQTTHT